MTTSGGTVFRQMLARVTRQDLRDQLTQVQGQLQLIHEQQGKALHSLVIQGDLLRQARHHITHLESLVTEVSTNLDTSTTEIVAALDDLITAVGTGPEALAAALAEIQVKNAQITTLQADDDADAEQIAALTTERDQLVADSVENVAKLQAATERARAVVPATEVPAEPVTDLESAPVDTSGDNA